ncbi:hypothetical protein SMICM304S_09148 [Streptomyces microflavus]
MARMPSGSERAALSLKDAEPVLELTRLTLEQRRAGRSRSTS